jgi:hypothetical protein
MRCTSAGQASLLALLSLSFLINTTLAWPTYNLHNSHLAKRQSSDNPPSGGEESDPVFNEEYDFIVAGGKSVVL